MKELLKEYWWGVLFPGIIIAFIASAFMGPLAFVCVIAAIIVLTLVGLIFG